MKQEKILIVEDEVIISMAIEETLANLGYSNIETAFDGASAQEAILNNNYDIVLMDINLGGDLDGIDIMNSVKQYIDVPFLYITGNSDLKTINKAKFSKPSGFLIKPFNETDLKINLEFTLFKEVRKTETERLSSGFSYDEELKKLIMRVGVEGQIFYVNSYIENITGQPASFYNAKTIKSAGLESFFSCTLSNIIYEVKETNKQVFYCTVKSVKHGERIMEILVTPDGFSNNSFGSYIMFFNDITDLSSQSTHKSKPTDIKIAIACDDTDILPGFRALPSFLENTEISVEFNDPASVIDYYKKQTTDILVIDINMPGGNNILQFLTTLPEKKPKVIIMALRADIERLRLFKELYSIDGYFSKKASDETIKSAIDSVMNNEQYYDMEIKKFE